MLLSRPATDRRRLSRTEALAGGRLSRTESLLLGRGPAGQCLRLPQQLVRRWPWLVLLVIYPVLGCNGDKGCGPSRATVARVIDGDTVELSGGERVRYLGVDTPEMSTNPPECFAEVSREYNADLVLEQEVRLEYDEECRDRYDRLLAYVYVGDRMVNRLLLQGGYAEAYIIPPNVKYEEEFGQLEAEARQDERGLWGMCQ